VGASRTALGGGGENLLGAMRVGQLAVMGPGRAGRSIAAGVSRAPFRIPFTQPVHWIFLL